MVLVHNIVYRDCQNTTRVITKEMKNLTRIDNCASVHLWLGLKLNSDKNALFRLTSNVRSPGSWMFFLISKHSLETASKAKIILGWQGNHSRCSVSIIPRTITKAKQLRFISYRVSKHSLRMAVIWITSLSDTHKAQNQSGTLEFKWSLIKPSLIPNDF